MAVFLRKAGSLSDYSYHLLFHLSLLLSLYLAISYLTSAKWRTLYLGKRNPEGGSITLSGHGCYAIDILILLSLKNLV